MGTKSNEGLVEKIFDVKEAILVEPLEANLIALKKEVRTFEGKKCIDNLEDIFEDLVHKSTVENIVDEILDMVYDKKKDPAVVYFHIKNKYKSCF